MIDAHQRLRNINTKVRIIGRRNCADFMAGKLDVLPCLSDLRDEAIVREFERLQEQHQ